MSVIKVCKSLVVDILEDFTSGSEELSRPSVEDKFSKLLLVLDESAFEVSVDWTSANVGSTVEEVEGLVIASDVDVVGVDVVDDDVAGAFVVGIDVDVEMTFGTDVDKVSFSTTTASLASSIGSESTDENTIALEVITFGASNNAGSSAPPKILTHDSETVCS